MTKYAIAPVDAIHGDGESYIIAGKLYSVLTDDVGIRSRGFKIIDEYGATRFCLTYGCGHIECKDWTIIETDGEINV